MFNANSNCTIRKRLIFAFVAVWLISGLTGIIAIRINSEILVDIRQLENSAAQKPAHAERLMEAIIRLGFLVELAHDASHFDSDGNLSPEIADRLSNRFSEEKAAFLEALEQNKIFVSIGAELAMEDAQEDEIASTHTEIKLLEAIESGFREFSSNFTSWVESGNLGSTASDPLGIESSYLVLQDLVSRFRTNAEQQVEVEVEETHEALEKASYIILISGLVAGIAGVTIAIQFSRFLANPLVELSEKAKLIGQGNLDIQVNRSSCGELSVLADTFNQMVTNLRETTVSKSYLTGVIESMEAALIIVDSKLRMIYINQSAAELLETDQETAKDAPARFVADVAKVSGANFLRDLLDRSATVAQKEIFFKSASGREIPVDFSATVLRDAASDSHHLICVAQDISERRENETKLEKAYRDLATASRQAGMAEVATGVLHNVGNVLNSVNVSAECAAERIEKSRSANLQKVARMIEENRENLADFISRDPKGVLIPDYLHKLSKHLEDENRFLVGELRLLRKNIEHIKEIVSIQQLHAKSTAISEPLAISELIEDSIRINKASLERHHIEVIREYQSVPMVLAERHQVIQILVNLLSNSRYALLEIRNRPREIRIRTFHDPTGVTVQVIDNGVGIEPQNMARIFQHGFTTRESGHGFGLHSGALAAEKMGGNISAESAGKDQGTTLTLKLPIAKGK